MKGSILQAVRLQSSKMQFAKRPEGLLWKDLHKMTHSILHTYTNPHKDSEEYSANIYMKRSSVLFEIYHLHTALVFKELGINKTHFQMALNRCHCVKTCTLQFLSVPQGVKGLR